MSRSHSDVGNKEREEREEEDADEESLLMVKVWKEGSRRCDVC